MQKQEIILALSITALSLCVILLFSSVKKTEPKPTILQKLIEHKRKYV